jgi:hypothetical protein
VKDSKPRVRRTKAEIAAGRVANGNGAPVVGDKIPALKTSAAKKIENERGADVCGAATETTVAVTETVPHKAEAAGPDIAPIAAQEGPSNGEWGDWPAGAGDMPSWLNDGPGYETAPEHYFNGTAEEMDAESTTEQPNGHDTEAQPEPQEEREQETAQEQRSGTLEPDIEQIALYTGALFRHAAENTFVSLKGFFNDDSNDPSFPALPVAIGATNRFGLLNTSAGQYARKCAVDERRGGSVFCVPPCTFKDRDSAKKTAVASGVALFADIDKNPIAALEALVKVLGPPTLVVRSGGEWLNPATGEYEPKVHVYWRLKTPARSEDACKALDRAIKLAAAVAGLGGDRSMTIVHPVRVPGSWHTKNRAKPVLCRIATIDADIEIDLADALAKLEAACPQDKAKADAGKDYDTQDGHDWSTLIDLVLTSESFHEPLTVLASKMLVAGMNDGAAVNLLRGLMMKAEGPKDARWEARCDYIPRAVSTAREKIDGGEWTVHAEAKDSADVDPDLGVLRLHRREPVPFPLEILGPFWGPWVERAAESKASPVDYVASALLTSTSALVGHARWAQAWDGWEEPPHLWGGNVGDSGDGKSPGADAVLKDVVPEIESRMTRNFPVTLMNAQRDIEIANAKLEAWKAGIKDAVKKARPHPHTLAKYRMSLSPRGS